MTPSDAFQDALAHGMHHLGKTAKLPPLSWRWLVWVGVMEGHAGADYEDSEVGPALEQWAKYLALDEVPTPPCAGTRAFRGEICGLTVDVWGVVDREVFDADTATSTP